MIAIMEPKDYIIKIDDVSSIYRGKPHMCRCGCSGTYTYSSAYAKEESESHGYEVASNDAIVKRGVNQMNKAIVDRTANVELIDDGDGERIYNWDISDRTCLTIYVKPHKQGKE